MIKGISASIKSFFFDVNTLEKRGFASYKTEDLQIKKILTKGHPPFLQRDRNCDHKIYSVIAQHTFNNLLNFFKNDILKISYHIDQISENQKFSTDLEKLHFKINYIHFLIMQSSASDANASSWRFEPSTITDLETISDETMKATTLLSEYSKDKTERMLIDLGCWNGTGTFGYVRMLNEENISLSKVIGYDINPSAIAVARATVTEITSHEYKTFYHFKYQDLSNIQLQEEGAKIVCALRLLPVMHIDEISHLLSSLYKQLFNHDLLCISVSYKNDDMYKLHEGYCNNSVSDESTGLISFVKDNQVLQTYFNDEKCFLSYVANHGFDIIAQAFDQDDTVFNHQKTTQHRGIYLLKKVE